MWNGFVDKPEIYKLNVLYSRPVDLIHHRRRKEEMKN